ncbi:hypothetical protein [Flavobacterium sp. ASW18X]|uniref:hypothetical protein n=1 Tax=Flavobacterium sp. ASW18X TaxID=2572595 RepID=UPI0010ADEF75|nr:hypothetical protein [Flavobacterium sp. ASW18X]TKD63627.1 hypothetical protein FBT53_07905 [Flavobacterium sp. ASW18X]
MMLRNSLLMFILSVVILVSCDKKSKYEQVVLEEKATGKIYDSLFFDFTFGQTKQQFFNQCWQLNNQQKVSQGPQNSFVQYILPKSPKDSATSSIVMLFYGIFDKDQIMTGMDFKFYHSGWSIWNKDLQAEKLLPQVRDSLLKWYPGNDFIEVKGKNSSEIFLTKVDGNRRIVIEPLKDTKDIDVRIDDLRYEQKTK